MGTRKINKSDSKRGEWRRKGHQTFSFRRAHNVPNHGYPQRTDSYFLIFRLRTKVQDKAKTFCYVPETSMVKVESLGWGTEIKLRRLVGSLLGGPLHFLRSLELRAPKEGLNKEREPLEGTEWAIRWLWITSLTKLYRHTPLWSTLIPWHFISPRLLSMATWRAVDCTISQGCPSSWSRNARFSWLPQSVWEYHMSVQNLCLTIRGIRFFILSPKSNITQRKS